MQSFKLKDTYIGANTSIGFFSLFDEFVNSVEKAYIIKGGPGTGKSSFMKKIAQSVEKLGYTTERIHCSSDPESLDGVYINELDTAFLDGTPPHVLEPPYPGVCGNIINLGNYWDEKALIPFKDEIIKLNKQISACFLRAYRMLSSAGYAYRDISCAAEKYLNYEKLDKYVENFIKKHLLTKTSDQIIKKRFAGAYSPFGYINFKDNFYSNVLEVEDKHHTSGILLEKLYLSAIKHGHSVTVFYNSLCPNEIDHLNIDSISMSIITSNDKFVYYGLPYNKVRMIRFLKSGYENEKEKMKFSKKITQYLEKEAVSELKNAKKLHDELETYYIKAMDFSSVDRAAESMINKLI